MKKYNVIILAGGEKGPLFAPTGYAEKALLPIRGKPMLSRVIEAFRESSHVDQIVVVGSSNLDQLEAMTHVRKRVFSGMNLIQNVLLAVTYLKHRVYAGAGDHGGYLFSFCDAVFLTPEVIDDTLSRIEASQGELVLHYVERSTFEAANLAAERTYIPIAGKHYTGSTIYYVHKFSRLLSALPKLTQLRQHRKDPQKMLELIGCRGADLPEIERALSEKLGMQVRICVSPHPELGMDVDKPADLELAVRWLEHREG